jgi:hypothetical protein
MLWQHSSEECHSALILMCTLKSNVSGHMFYDIFYLFLNKESHYGQLLQESNFNLHINFFDSDNYNTLKNKDKIWSAILYDRRPVTEKQIMQHRKWRFWIHALRIVLPGPVYESMIKWKASHFTVHLQIKAFSVSKEIIAVPKQGH